jgi:phage shock protein A
MSSTTVHHAISCTPTFQSLPGVSTHTCIEFTIFDNPWVQTAALHFSKFDMHQVVDKYDRTLGHKALDTVRGSNRTVVVRTTDGHECSASGQGGVQSTTNNVRIQRDIFDRSDTFDAEASLRELQTEKQTLESEYQHVDKERKGAMDRVKKIKDQIERLQSEIAGFQKKRKQCMLEASELELEAEQMPQEFDESSYAESIRGKEQILSARRVELGRIADEIAAFEQGNADVQAQIKKLSEKRREVEQKMQSTRPVASQFARRAGCIIL